MKRFIIVLIFWVLGFIGGMAVYFTLPSIVNFFNWFFPHFLSKHFLYALAAGIIGSLISTIAVIFWAKKTSKEF
jgi:hypothetical protein